MKSGATDFFELRLVMGGDGVGLRIEVGRQISNLILQLTEEVSLDQDCTSRPGRECEIFYLL